MSIRQLVEDLPEVYQPVLGHPEFDEDSARACDDRLDILLKLVESARRNGRPFRVLDIGCAQGYFSLSLAKAGCEVTGIDKSPENIALCRALADEHGLNASFSNESVTPGYGADLPAQHYDLVILFSVAHHLCHEWGYGAVRDWLSMLSGKTDVLISELALKSEPLYWAEKLPEDEREVLKGFAFVKPLGFFPTHLSSVIRPMYFASNTTAYMNGEAFPIRHATRSAHVFDQGSHMESRSYYFTDDSLIKLYRLDGPRGEFNTGEMAGELDVLRRFGGRAAGIPELLGEERIGDYWLSRRAMPPGTLLSDLVRSDVWLPIESIVSGLLGELVDLERHGLCHNDLRTWNVMLDDEGRVRLIDYGAISEQRTEDVVAAFFMTAYDLINRIIPRASHVLLRRSNPLNFEGRMRALAARAFIEEATFSRLLEWWRDPDLAVPEFSEFEWKLIRDNRELEEQLNNALLDVAGAGVGEET